MKSHALSTNINLTHYDLSQQPATISAGQQGRTPLPNTNFTKVMFKTYFLSQVDMTQIPKMRDTFFILMIKIQELRLGGKTIAKSTVGSGCRQFELSRV